MKLLPPTRLVLSFFSIPFSFFYCTGEGVADGESECEDDENVKSATFTHLFLYCLSLQEWEGGVGKHWRVKDRGLTSVVRQPAGLDGIY